MSLVLTGAVSLAGALPAAAQPVTIAADVPVSSPTGAGTRNLSFGVVQPQAGGSVLVSVPAAVAPVSATVHSGQFRFNVQNSRGVTFTLQTPPELVSGSFTMPVNYNDTQFGGHCVDTGSGCTLTNFNPAASPQVRVCRQTLGNGNCHPVNTWAANSMLSVYVGGALSVPPGQRAGTYTGTVTLTIIQVH
jgi:hypothetical protein